MTDEELISWLRKYSSTNAADRIEALLAERDAANALLRELITANNTTDGQRMRRAWDAARAHLGAKS